ncbi:MAG TPA: deoxyribonuclease IV [Nitrososphaerales archaeon]|nr:deoxyribonuclease IV [Nitrososphaerales archaeon]
MPAEPMVGLHVSIAGSLESAFDRAAELGANTFQIFTRNPNQWKFKPIPDDVAGSFKERRKKSGIRRIVDHMPYLPNLASPDKATMKISRFSLDEEVKRCDELGIDYLVVHLGSHLGKGIAVGINNVADACNGALSESGGKTSILLENMAGQSHSVGSRFEELRAILDKVKVNERVGVCVDSCHAFASGFDLRDKAAVEHTMGLFGEIVGFDRLKVVHLNDSKGTLGSRLDRHENIGRGKIGRKGIRDFLHYPGVSERPLIMETPYDEIKTMEKSIKLVRTLLR